MGASRKNSSAPRSRQRRTLKPELERVREGLSWYSEAKVPFRRLHCHDHIEVSVNEHAPVVAMFGGNRLLLPPDCLVVFWAARPHGPIETHAGGLAHGVNIPTAAILPWRLPSSLTQALFSGQVLIDPPGPRPATDLELVKNWVQLLGQNAAEARQVVLLEVEARLRRIALNERARQANRLILGKAPPPSHGALGRFEKMASLIALHFDEPLTIQDIADAVQLSPDAAMRLFRRMSGITLHNCILQHRVGNAQRLLATTNLSIAATGLQSGFGSVARFYAAFQKVVGQSPAAYRRAFDS